MKKRMAFLLVCMLAASQIGCGSGPAASGAEETQEGSMAASAAEETRESSMAASETEKDRDTEAETDENQKEDETERDAASQETLFTDMELEMSQGDLYIRTGEVFSFKLEKGKEAEYEIQDGTLYFDNEKSGKYILILPEEEDYETLTLYVGEGHVYLEDSLSLQNLKLSVSRGEARLEKLEVSEDCRIEVEQGSASLTGDPGKNISAVCREGHLSMEPSFAQEECDYEISLSGGGNIRFGDKDYHGLSASDSADNGESRFISLECKRGDISVLFQ